jgi:hypothetical protein
MWLQDMLALDKARIPVLKFKLPQSSTKVDITINNELPLHNTRLLKAYADIDPRVRQLIFLVKHWAKQRYINDAYTGSLSSYAWVLMCVFVAQRAGVVPVLQLPSQVPALEVDTVVEVDGDEWSVQYTTDGSFFKEEARKQRIPTAGLLTMFFDYFASRRGPFSLRYLQTATPAVCVSRSQLFGQRAGRPPRRCPAVCRIPLQSRAGCCLRGRSNASLGTQCFTAKTKQQVRPAARCR